jgi:hypothetical protein
MTSTTQERRVYPSIDPTSGNPVYACTLTPAERTDTVKLVCSPMNVLPIIFVPGIMGSNLKRKGSSTDQKVDSKNWKTNQVWRLDSAGALWWDKGGAKAGPRQILLHPARTEVDPMGEVPKARLGILTNEEAYRARGWGEVGAASHQDFLMNLEDSLNGGKDGDGKHSEQSAVLALKEVTDKWRAQKSFDPLTDAENKKAIEWHYPVYAVGYNWLDDNKNAATRLQERINQIIKDNNRGMGKCEQVIVVTHSMGGLQQTGRHGSQNCRRGTWCHARQRCSRGVQALQSGHVGRERIECDRQTRRTYHWAKRSRNHGRICPSTRRFATLAQQPISQQLVRDQG